MASKAFSSPLSLTKIAFPLAVAALCGFSAFRGPTFRLSAFALAFSSIGGTAGYVVAKERGTGRISQLEKQLRQSGASLEVSRNESSALKAKVAEGVSHLQALTQQLNALRENRDVIASERDRIQSEMLTQSAQLTNAAAIAAQRLADNGILAGQLETLEVERMSLIYELYETAVTEADIAASVAKLEAQFQNDSAYQLGQKKKAKSELTKSRADFHTKVSELEETIASLETQLAEKTALAQGIITDYERDANGQLDQFGGELGNQSQLIKSLRVQLEESRKTVKALTYRRFDSAGTDNTYGNRLIDSLAKHGSTYGAFHHEREGHNGRLKVWLSIIDAPLSRAQDCLDELESELSLWAKPRVEVSRGMHLFTLATEQEHKIIELPKDNLTRLEKDFDTANHIRLVGPTGSGKSTFLDNLIWLGRYSWPSAKMELLDPKAPFTKWQGGIVPDFKNLECVAAIENISKRLQLRFADANKVAEEYGNESAEFEKHIDGLSPYLFVLDEAQYLYRIAKAEDAKASPKGKQANLVRDSLLDCLGVGRALKVKGYFITQSAKCSKLGMNEDDFDNATAIFLGSAIANALDGELKGAFSDSKLAKVKAEYLHRKQLNQQYLALVSYSESDTLYLIQCPQPGFYHARFLEAQTDFDPGAGTKVQNAEPVVATEEQQGTSGGAAAANVPNAPSLHPGQILTEGTAACPSCGTFSTTIRNGKINSLGKVKFGCKNSDCKKQIFSAVPVI